MKINLQELKQRQQAYLIAKWEDGQLVMEPYCSCGGVLDEDYFCRDCERECDCTLIACEDAQALSVAEKLIQSNPSFKNYATTLISN